MSFALSLLGTQLPARSALANDATDEEEAVRRGVTLRREQHDEEALAEFRRAYAIHPRARTRAQIALAEQALGRWLEAETDLTAALAATDDPWVERNMPSLEAARATIARHLGTVEISANVAGAALFIDGRAAGTLPCGPIRVEAGSIMIEVRALGYGTARRIVDVPSTARVRETFTLVSMEPLPAATRPLEPARAEPPAALAKSEPAPRPRPLVWIGFTVAGVGALTGGITGAMALGKASSAKSSCPDLQCSGDGFHDVQTGRSLGTLSTVAFLVAGAGAALGIYGLVANPSEGARTKPVAFVPWIGAGTAGIDGSF